MLYPSIDNLLSQIGSKYLLVNVVSKRLTQIKKTGHYQLEPSEYKSTKNIGKTLEEISKGLIHIK